MVKKVHQNLTNSHVLNCHVLEDLATVHIPYSLTVPNLGGKKNGSKTILLQVVGQMSISA